jgi:ABC-type dipeptide/oligopeptide/nickel transport system permease subunit
MSDHVSTTVLDDRPEPPAVEAPTSPGTPPGRERSASLWADAFRQLVRKPTVLIPAFIIALVASMAIFPKLWTSQDPHACDVSRSRLTPRVGHLFGFDVLGCDYYTSAIYGARPSLSIAVGATAGTILVGGLLGMIAGFYGGWLDAIISRVTDIFFALPFLLGAIVFLTVIRTRNVWTIMSILIILGWTTVARVMRGNVLASKNLDYVQAARALGASNWRLMTKHILPNAVAPVLVLASIALGGYVAAEATLSFLGVGLIPPAISWGIMIASNQGYFDQYPLLLLFPCLFLVGTVLSFILLGDALRDALDPKLR